MAEMATIGVVNRFKVVMNGNFELGHWSKVDGLNVSWDIAEYRAGDMGNFRYYFPGNTKYQEVVLERAACADSTKVKEWLTANSFGWKPQPGEIQLFDYALSTPMMRWELKDVLVKSWKITGFDAGGSNVARETLTLVHRGFLDDEIR
jgi:phage tail-like protein